MERKVCVVRKVLQETLMENGDVSELKGLNNEETNSTGVSLGCG